MAAAAAAAAAASLSFQVYLKGKPVKDFRAVVSDRCRNFYGLGWVTGTGGSTTAHKPDQLVVIPPSRTRKQRMVPEDMYVLSDGGAVVLSAPSPKPYANKPPKCMACAPLFMKNLRSQKRERGRKRRQERKRENATS